jgi:O-methyltransferase
MKGLSKLIANPRKYVPLAGRMVLQKCCWLFQDASFFLQGQMDIHPRSHWHTDLVDLTGGFYPRPNDADRQIFNLDAHDNTRRDMLILLLRTVIEHGVPGAFAEIGVYKGLTARLIHHYAPERALHLFDTFEGFTERSAAVELQSHRQTTSLFSDTSLEAVRAFVHQRNENVLFHKGFFPESIPSSLFDHTFAFVHLDADLYDPIFQGLSFFYPRLSPRGMIVVHDYNSWPGSRKAVDEFFRDKPELPIPMPDKSGSVLIVKS